MIKTSISVIMPVYNAEKHLEEAVQSVLNQTYPYWELLLIDDGSTDLSAGICDRYAQLDERICVYHTENRGPSHARNIGLHASSGAWIAFLDSDDCFKPDTLETALRYIDSVDIVWFGMEYFPVQKHAPWTDRIRDYPSLGKAGAEAQTLFGYDGLNAVWNKLYRRDAVHARFDEDLRYAEDMFFNHEVMNACKGIRLIPEVLYRYRWDGELTLTKRFWLNQFEISKRALVERRRIFENCAEMKAYVNRRFALEICRYVWMMTKIRGIPEEHRILILRMQMDDDILKDREIGLTTKEPVLDELWQAICSGDAVHVFETFRRLNDEFIRFRW